jgi:hypothetical protein
LQCCFCFIIYFCLAHIHRSVRFDYLVGNLSHSLYGFFFSFYPILSLSIIISSFLPIKHHYFSSHISGHFLFPVPDIREIEAYCWVSERFLPLWVCFDLDIGLQQKWQFFP